VHTGFDGENLRERGHLEDLGVDRGIILKCIFRKWDMGAWIGLICVRIGPVGGNCKCGNETLGSLKCREFLD
jgi:hypothetical protein